MATTAAVAGQLAASAPRQGGSYSGMDEREAKYNAAMTGKSGGMTTNADGEMYDADAVYRPANQADHIHNQYLDDRKKEQEKVSCYLELDLAEDEGPSKNSPKNLTLPSPRRCAFANAPRLSPLDQSNRLV